MDIQQINIAEHLALISPILVLSLGAFILMLVEVLAGKHWPRSMVATVIVVMALVCAFGVSSVGVSETVFLNMLYVDPFTKLISQLILLATLMVVIMGMNNLRMESIKHEGEYYILLLMCSAGALIFSSAAELITLFIGLEIMSMALYCLCGSVIGSRSSSESAIKYFILGSFSSAFLLYGIALLYGLTGSLVISEIGGALSASEGLLKYFAIGLVLTGLVFKIGIVPFHFWAPDVYQGAPSSITTYMASVVKIAAIAATLRMFWQGFADFIPYWTSAVWYMAVFTMVLGNLAALRQKNIKRMLAYSSIAHAGYIMMAMLVPDSHFDSGAGAAIVYYLVVYSIMTIGSFGVLLALTSSDKKADNTLESINGLGYTRPYLAAMMALFMFALAGLPPGLSGLVGKFYIFSTAVRSGYTGLAIIAVISAAIACFYYLRVIVHMYFKEQEEERPFYQLNPALLGVLSICAIGVVALGLYPNWLHQGLSEIMATF